MRRRPTASTYTWPESLSSLRDWLARRGCDVLALKSERQALYLMKALCRQPVDWPERGQSCFPELLRIQAAICRAGGQKTKRGKVTERRAFKRREKPVQGTFGAASPVRRVSVEQYLAEKRGGDPS
jgi:hypothetical protein